MELKKIDDDDGKHYDFFKKKDQGLNLTRGTSFALMHVSHTHSA